MLGAIDVANQQVETPDEAAETFCKALAYVDAEKLIPSTNCGMALFPCDAALSKFSASSAGAAVLREELVGARV